MSIKHYTTAREIEYHSTMASLEQTARRLDCMVPFHHAVQNNRSADAPYHNKYHIAFMTNRALDMLVIESDFTIYSDDMRVLLIAGMFHDVNHSMGKEADSYNIQEAIRTLNECPDYPHSYLNERIESAIRCTEFPFQREPIGLVEKCLRDSDLMTITEVSGAYALMYGLREELRHKRGFIPFSELLDMHKSFLDKAEFFTDTGKSMFFGAKNECLQQMAEIAAKEEGCDGTPY